jgi:hypothetical protein
MKPPPALHTWPELVIDNWVVLCLPELPISMGSRREIRRRKRGWAKGKACCVAMLGDTVKALRRTREDAAAVAVKLAELQAGEVKNLRAAASEIHTHVDLLRAEVQVIISYVPLWSNPGMEDHIRYASIIY